MKRVVAARTTALELYVYTADGAGQDLDALPTVSVADGGGTVVATGTATKPASTTGLYRFNVTPAALDTYTSTWTGALGGVAQTYSLPFEAAGALTFTVADFRAFEGAKFANTSTWPTARIEEAREQAEEELETWCEVAFVPRGHREMLLGDGTADLWLSKKRVRAVLSATVDGSAVAVGDLTLWGQDGRVVHPTTWTDDGVVVVHYTHGWDACPAPVKRALMLLAMDKLVPSNIEDRTITFTDELGTRQLAVAGRERPFGIPEVDAVAWKYQEQDVGLG